MTLAYAAQFAMIEEQRAQAKRTSRIDEKLRCRVPDDSKLPTKPSEGLQRW